MSDQFGDPGTSSGIDLNSLTGSLLLIKALRVEYGINTSLGAKDATVANVHVLDGTEAGTIYNEVFIWPKVMQSELKDYVGAEKFALGRLGKGTAKPGQNAPWKLLIAADADKATARAYLANPAAAKPKTKPDNGFAAGDDEAPF
jgi:hypothetical protein